MADTITKEDLYYPNTSAIDNDFIGFSFNGVSSQSLGISRVSDGSRYNEQMLPGFQDKSAQMPGSDYTLYWESFYNTKTWTIDIAFDHMTYQNMIDFRQTFHTKNLGELKFAERTYMDKNDNIHQIHWLAKVQSPPQLKYICFDEDNKRIYKGEGTIQFVAYYPYGMSELQTLATSAAGTSITNSGEIDMEWSIKIPKPQSSSTAFVIKDEVTANDNIRILRFDNGIDLKTGDTHLLISSKTNLIEGIDTNGNKTGNVYNQFITAGDFFKIPVGVSTFFGGGDLYYNFLYL